MARRSVLLFLLPPLAVALSSITDAPPALMRVAMARRQARENRVAAHSKAEAEAAAKASLIQLQFARELFVPKAPPAAPRMRRTACAPASVSEGDVAWHEMGLVREVMVRHETKRAEIQDVEWKEMGLADSVRIRPRRAGRVIQLPLVEAPPPRTVVRFGDTLQLGAEVDRIMARPGAGAPPASQRAPEPLVVPART